MAKRTGISILVFVALAVSFWRFFALSLPFAASSLAVQATYDFLYKNKPYHLVYQTQVFPERRWIGLESLTFWAPKRRGFLARLEDGSILYLFGEFPESGLYPGFAELQSKRHVDMNGFRWVWFDRFPHPRNGVLSISNHLPLNEKTDEDPLTPIQSAKMSLDILSDTSGAKREDQDDRFSNLVLEVPFLSRGKAALEKGDVYQGIIGREIPPKQAEWMRDQSGWRDLFGPCKILVPSPQQLQSLVAAQQDDQKKPTALSLAQENDAWLLGKGQGVHRSVEGLYYAGSLPDLQDLPSQKAVRSFTDGVRRCTLPADVSLESSTYLSLGDKKMFVIGRTFSARVVLAPQAE